MGATAILGCLSTNCVIEVVCWGQRGQYPASGLGKPPAHPCPAKAVLAQPETALVSPPWEKAEWTEKEENGA